MQTRMGRDGCFSQVVVARVGRSVMGGGGWRHIPSLQGWPSLTKQTQHSQSFLYISFFCTWQIPQDRLSQPSWGRRVLRTPKSHGLTCPPPSAYLSLRRGRYCQIRGPLGLVRGFSSLSTMKPKGLYSLSWPKAGTDKLHKSQYHLALGSIT